MKVEDRALADLAASVADGTPVDWQSAETQAGARGRDLRLVRHLRLVDSIAALHRSLQPDDSREAEEPFVADGRRWGHLVLLERIGAGTSCEVFRAWDSELHRDVALKLLHGDGLGGADSREDHARLLEEARRLARLRHGNIVQVYGADRHDGRVGLWMELVRGTSLEELVHERGSFGAREAALLGLDVCAALAAVHGAGLLHRDVKAQNVMREDGGRTVLMDFGTGEELSGTNRMIGTPLYLAPEIFRGQRASVQSDIYSVGVLLFYLVTGKFPVVATTMEELAAAHDNRTRKPLRDLRPDVPEGFVRVVERALDSDPLRRYRSVGELEQGLRESLDVQTTAAPSVAAAKPQRRSLTTSLTTSLTRSLTRSLTTSVTAGAIAAALMVLIAALIVWTRSSGPAPAAPAVKRLAVLPFSAVSNSAAAPYLADELTDQLISTLGQIRSLQVTSLTSVLQFKDRRPSIPDIGRQLNVDHVLETTLTVVNDPNGHPDRLRVNTRLIAAGTDAQIWSDTIDRSLGDTLALQSEVARAIADGIRAALTPDERRRLQQPQKTTPDANYAYFQGLHFLSQSSADADHAVDAFRRATTLDPNHAGAHAGLARGLMSLGFVGTLSHPEARALALAEARRSVEIDPESSEGHAILADLQFYYDWDWAGADRSYQQAIALNSSFARARSQYARYLSASRRNSDAIAEASRAADLDPMSASAHSTRSLTLYYARDFEGALRAIDQALQLEPSSAGAHFVLSRILSARGDQQQAILENERALTLAGTGAAFSWKVHLLRLRALAGAQDVAQVAIQKLPADAAAGRARLGPAYLATVYEALGDQPTAFRLLEQAVDQRDPEVLWLAVDPRLDSLRSNARFEQLLTRIGVPH